jgi:glycine/D-amino acid oxidase-like deaminating enzyme
MQVSVWEKESFYAPKDVIIIGSGFVGLWCAWCLLKKNPRLSITIADRGIIPTGASTRNAGFACFGSVTELLSDLEKQGEDSMLDLVEMRYRGLQRIRKLFPDPVIDFDLCGGYELFTDKQAIEREALKNKLHTLNKLLRPVLKEDRTFRLADKKVSAFGFDHVSHLVETKLEGALHSGKLCQSLLRAVQSKGVNVLNAIEVTGFEKVNDKIVLHTNQSLHLSASQVLICTNAFTKQLLPDLDIVPARGQILVTSPIKKLPFKGTFHYDEGFYYFRSLGNRVLLGGARNVALQDEATADMITSSAIQQALEQFLSIYILPGQQYAITDRWSGIMGMGTEKLPIVREVSPQVFCAARMSGMGVALAPVVGEKIAKMML